MTAVVNPRAIASLIAGAVISSMRSAFIRAYSFGFICSIIFASTQRSPPIMM